jgi:UPF0042 nucleotide-binding protein
VRIIIISGLSGSGKSIALNALEDENFYCIDNLPISLLATFIDQCANDEHEHHENIAIGIDARAGLSLENLSDTLKTLKENHTAIEIVFLSAEVNILLKRFSETRRKHPLTNKDTPLIEAITLEKELLSSLSENADLTIDTSKKNVRQLRSLIGQLIVKKNSSKLNVILQSFGYKYGVPTDSDFMFDVRCLPNPYWDLSIRNLSGHDQLVIDFFEKNSEVEEMINSIHTFITRWINLFASENRSYLTLSIGCTGGHHRSVYCINKLAVLLNNLDYPISVRHREFE